MEAKHEHPKYVAVWAWLLLLLFLSVAAVYLPFSQGMVVAFIFIVAVVKAGLVAVYFSPSITPSHSDRHDGGCACLSHGGETGVRVLEPPRNRKLPPTRRTELKT